jgi:exonuclease SbcC
VKILHTADLHYRPADADLALASLRTVRETVEREHVDLVVFAGDMFDRAIHNSEAARLPDLMEAWREIMDLCPVVAVSGTPTHDVAGSYEPLARLHARNTFTMLDPGEPYFALDGKLLVLGCPEPSKEWFLADKTGLGREQAAEAVVSGMRQLLLGLGAIRKEHADLPALMVYHGQVAGATLASGQALRPGGIQIGRDDLALVGADYYALGDIHLAQQIGDLPAYYAGSAYPCNWGELDQKGCWMVDIADRFTGAYEDDASTNKRTFATSFQAELTRVPFPHAPRKKITTTWPVGLDLFEPDGQVEGFQVWVDVQVTQELAASLNTEATLRGLLACGALEGSRVTASVIPTETVRAGEISEAQGLSAKLCIYAENSNEAPPEGVPEKAEHLEAEARAEGVAPAGLHIRIDRLRLRGAIGIWKGQGVDDVEIDLGGYDDGLIAMLGPNGAGKTTLIENLHPFPSMLTRDGKLQDHYRLRDSYRDLEWTDVRTGDTFRSLIQIDGANASGACDYHLYRNGEPIANGRKADYEEQIKRLFGSLSLYLRSAFVTQRASRGAPELSEATKGERKSLFRELGGLDYLQDYADRAKAHAKGLEAALLTDAGEIAALERDTTDVPDYAAALVTSRILLDAEREGTAAIEARGHDLRAQSDAAQARLGAHRKAETELNGLHNQVVTLGHERGNAEQAIIALKDALRRRPEWQAQLAKYEALKAQEEKENEKRTDILLDRERLTTEHGRALEAHRTAQRKVESRQRELTDQAAALAREKDREVSAVDALLALLHSVECPHCHKTFALGGNTEQASVEAKQQRVLDLDMDLVMIERDQDKAAAELAALVAPAAPMLPGFDDGALRDILHDLEGYDIRVIRNALAQADKADAGIEAAGQRIMAIEVQLSGLKGQIAGAEGRLDPPAEECLRALNEALDVSAQRWRDARATIARLQAELAAAEKALADIERKRALLATARERVAGRQAEAAAWRWLERACGPDGIQALELDAMGPGIAAVANRILEAAYGQRFQIAFVTTRLSGSGARAKQIEDFQIIVRDSERGGEQPIETLSGGESVWIKRALYDAFGIIRDRATGQRFLTVFQDEADGALDPEARVAYVRMLEAAHVESGRRHTILITHSETVQQLIAQRIDMHELARAREGAPA